MDDPENPGAGGDPRLINNGIDIEVIGNHLNHRNRNGPNVITMRDRLFHAIYFKIALMYAHIFPKPLQRALEYLILLKALLFFFILVYVHVAFIKNPASCLQDVNDWPRDGVLRVEVIPNLDQQRALLAKAKAEEQLIRDIQNHYYYSIGPQTIDNYRRLKEYQKYLSAGGYRLRPTFAYANETFIYYFKTEAIADSSKSSKRQAITDASLKAAQPSDDDDQYIVEYSLEYGHLRLSQATRKRLRIPIRVVQLDPMTNKCFGDNFSKFLLKQLLGYDDVLMASVRVIAEKEDNKGYLRNVITGEHYRFVTLWWAAWSSYPTALLIMLLFTLSISMLLRFSHHQIFVFIDLMQMLEFNMAAHFPIAPLLTVILALVGMEAIMSEFFNDATTAFYIIIIVWVADQFDAICCHTSITKRHWLRFFYLYHFVFYAYHYRFCGQNRTLALVCSWLFTQHSMFYFFHRYELPVIMQEAHVYIISRYQNAPAPAIDGAPAQQQQQQQPPQQNQQNHHPHQHRHRYQQLPTIVFNRNFLGQPLVVDAQNMRRFPFIGLVRPLITNRGTAVNSIRRALHAMGLMTPTRLRVEVHNIQFANVNVGSTPVNVEAGEGGAAAAEAAEAANGQVAAANDEPAAAAVGADSAAPISNAAPRSDDRDSSLTCTHRNLTGETNSRSVPEPTTNITMETAQSDDVEQQQPLNEEQQQSIAAADAMQLEENLKNHEDEVMENISEATSKTSATITNNYPQTGSESGNFTQLENDSNTKEHLSNSSGHEPSEAAIATISSSSASTSSSAATSNQSSCRTCEKLIEKQQAEDQGMENLKEKPEAAKNKSQTKVNPTDEMLLKEMPQSAATSSACCVAMERVESLSMIDEDKQAVVCGASGRTTTAAAATVAAAAEATTAADPSSCDNSHNNSGNSNCDGSIITNQSKANPSETSV